MREPRVLVIGGGAAGLTAAIAAARAGAAVTIVEGGARVGRKILVSGNGRCNLTNLSTAPEAYNQPDFVAPTLAAHPCEVIRSFFGGIGLLTSADDEGRVYPVTNTATSVLDVLRLECAHLGVEERCRLDVRRVSAEEAGVEVASVAGEVASADAVVVATGGGTRLLADLGHEMVPFRPVLLPLRTETAPIRGLSGVRVRCAATLLDDAGERVATERGELLFREYGVSGIMVFDLSRYLESGHVISIDLFPDVPRNELEGLLAERRRALSWRAAATFFEGMLHDRMAIAVMRAVPVGGNTPASELPLERIATVLKDFRLDVVGPGDAKQAQVTRGGAAVAGFDPRSMGSRLADGVFAAGETLDVDGRSGGFNLHWAWASGIVAGESAAGYARSRSGEPA